MSVAVADVDDSALFSALVLVPSAFSRNRFFKLFEDPERKRLRRRAARVRGIIRQLVEPERGRAEIAARAGELVRGLRSAIEAAGREAVR